MNSIKLFPLRKQVTKTIEVPGSKSYTNRVLFLASLCGGKVVIKNPLLSDDTVAMIECLRELGVNVQKEEKSIIIDSSSFAKLSPQNDNSKQSYSLSARLSGTTIRFILGLLCITAGIKTISGESGLNKRPIGDLVDAFVQLGAKIEYLDKKGYPPVRVLSCQLNEGTVRINGNISSQFISSILMIAPLVGKVEIKVSGRQSSKPFIDMTIDIMKKFGVNVINNDYKSYSINAGQKYNCKEYVVEGDYSSAAYFFAIATLTNSVITVRNLNPKSKQADVKFLKILEQMGNKISYAKDQITVKGIRVIPVNVDMEDCPDQIQTLAVLAAFVKGTTIIKGIGSLKIKETNRLLAVKNELKKMGIKNSSTSSKLTIYGGRPKPAKIATYSDHRMAMAFAVAGSKINGMEIENPEVVNKTFPEFWKKINEIGITSSPQNKIASSSPKASPRNDKINIVLIGMRGSGKTTVAKLLAKKLSKKYLELDGLLEKKVGIPISEIVKKYGWNFFREKEKEVAFEVSKYSDMIISTGGGVVLDKKNVEELKKNGVFVFLKASVGTLLSRIGEDKNRPFITKAKNRKEEIEKVLKQRKKLYKDAADIAIDTNNRSVEDIEAEILLRLRRIRMTN